MKKYSDSFTQGGQTELHKFHMMRQVFWATLKISGALAIISFFLLLFKDHIWQDYYFLGAYYKSILRAQLDFLPKDCFDTNWIMMDHRWVEVADSFITTDLRSLRFSTHLQDHIIKSLYQSLWIFSLSILAVSIFWIWRGKSRQKTKILKGYELVSPRKLSRLVNKQGASNIILGNIPLPLNSECEHMMITGTTGSGKTNLINHLLQQIKLRKEKAIIVDTTCGFVARFFDEKQDKIINPFDARTTDWSLWKECVEDYEFDEFSESLIPNEHYDKFWTKAGQQLFSEAVSKTKKTKNPSIDELLKILLSKPLKEICEYFKDSFVSTYVDPSAEKTALSIRATLVSALRNLKYLKNSNAKFSIREWIKDEKQTGWLFLSSLPTQREVIKPLMSAWLSIAIKTLMSLEENPNRRVWFIIDELASLNHIPILTQGLAEIRKYGGCLVLGIQDINRLDVLYGSSSARTLGALTGTKVAFRVDGDAAGQIARFFGEQETLDSNESISFGAHQMRDGVSLTEQQKIRPLISATDIMILNNLEAYLKFPRNLPVTKLTFKFIEHPKINEPFIKKKQKARRVDKSKNKEETENHVSEEIKQNPFVITWTPQKNETMELSD